MKHLRIILLLNLLGVALFLSGYLPFTHDAWFAVDKASFFFFNQRIVQHHWFAVLVALTNFRGFDGVSLLAMGILYFCLCRQHAVAYSRMLAMGITMLLTAVVLNQLGHLLPVHHSSPTLFFDNAIRVSKLTGIDAKDSSNNSFPGDHGMMLIIFACFMWRYFHFPAFLLALLIAVVFSLPRIMAGAHWVTDIAVGSVCVILVGLSWCLLTPLSDRLINALTRRLHHGYDFLTSRRKR